MAKPPAEDRARLVALLETLGASAAETEEALAQGSAGGLALELALRHGPRLPLTEAAAGAGVDAGTLTRLWQALGFPAQDDLHVPADVAATLPVVTQATREWLGEDAALALTRLVGATTARLAEALVDAFRLQFEVPEMTAGRPYTEVVEEYLAITRAALPSFEELVAAVLRAHLVRVASGSWIPDAEQAAAHRHLFVGFVDLVGYTALSRTLPPRELATVVAEFEGIASDAVTAHGGRLVKLIGDGALFVSDGVEPGCATAMDLAERIGTSDRLPPARVGADLGPVLSLYGDYFGDVVNRAARLVALANPGTVVVSEAVAADLPPKFAAERLPEQALKGFHAPAVTYRLVRR
ncbi:MAG TPA: adenylate/guanylate cyclase domain-containing protein [Mycobacteriales bacterium]|jgi:adenylate cyclase|nr:adenylate/guanylate cyclase domain-containing protein [Mycobacteriales bacterium]